MARLLAPRIDYYHGETSYTPLSTQPCAGHSRVYIVASRLADEAGLSFDSSRVSAGTINRNYVSGSSSDSLACYEADEGDLAARFVKGRFNNQIRIFYGHVSKCGLVRSDRRTDTKRFEFCSFRSFFGEFLLSDRCIRYIIVLT